MKIIKLLSKEELDSIKLVHLLKDEILFSEGDLCEYVGIVKDGELAIVSYLENGKEIIYNDLSEEQVFGNNLIFSSDPYFRGDVVAKKESDIYLIDKKALLSLMQNNVEFLLAYLKEQSDFGKHLNLNIKLLTFSGARERILYFLSINKNRITFKSISDLANKLFLTREATSRELHKLEAEKVILLKSKAIVKL